MDLGYLFIMVAALGCGGIASRLTRQEWTISAQQRRGVMLGAFLGAMLGAKLPFLFADWQRFVSGAAWFSDGKTILCGLAGGYVGVELAKYALGVTAKTGDGFVVPVSVTIGVGRFGCYHAGCCYGRPTTCPWGVVFPHVDDLPRHPTQLYEAAFHLGFAVFAVWLAHHGRLPRQRVKLYLLLYAGYRFVTEWLRPEPIWWWGLTGYQWGSLCLAAAMLLLWRQDARAVRTPATI